MWQFCLTRLQGILEGLIVFTFLPLEPDGTLFGIKSKLKAMQGVGYSINKKEYDLLLDWANFRNYLSHAPPAQHSPGPLRKEVVLDYKSLLERLCNRWRDEKT